MSVLKNAILAVLVFAVLYLISKGSENWSAWMVRSRERERERQATHEATRTMHSSVRPVKFGARFKHL